MEASKKISIIYVLVGVFWIFVSDTLIIFLWGNVDAEQLGYLQTAKGTLYVGLTGLLLYILISRHYQFLDKKVKELELANFKLKEERLNSEHSKTNWISLSSLHPMTLQSLFVKVRASWNYLSEKMKIRYQKNP